MNTTISGKKSGSLDHPLGSDAQTWYFLGFDDSLIYSVPRHISIGTTFGQIFFRKADNSILLVLISFISLHHITEVSLHGVGSQNKNKLINSNLYLYPAKELSRFAESVVLTK
jgi:hypothetical protein